MSSRKSADTAPAMVVGGDLVLAAHRIWICTPPPAPIYLRPAAAMRVRGRGGGVLSDLACRTGARRARAARCGAGLDRSRKRKDPETEVERVR
jgi:hypothetical protein